MKQTQFSRARICSIECDCIVCFFCCCSAATIHPDLARNRLTEIANGAFEMLLNLTHLDVSYNKLAKLEAASMEPLEKLQSLNISGNIRMDLHEMRPTLQVSWIGNTILDSALGCVRFFLLLFVSLLVARVIDVRTFFVRFISGFSLTCIVWVARNAVAIHTEFHSKLNRVIFFSGAAARSNTLDIANILVNFKNLFDTKIKISNKQNHCQMLQSKLNAVIQIRNFIGLHSLKMTGKKLPPASLLTPGFQHSHKLRSFTAQHEKLNFYPIPISHSSWKKWIFQFLFSNAAAATAEKKQTCGRSGVLCAGCVYGLCNVWRCSLRTRLHCILFLTWRQLDWSQRHIAASEAGTRYRSGSLLRK